jgi:hypothetical protein
VALLLFFGVVNQVLVRSWARRTTRVGVGSALRVSASDMGGPLASFVTV